MKKLFFFLATTCFASTVIAQDTTVTETPATVVMEPNQPYYYDMGMMQPTALEKLTGTRKTQMKLFGLGGGSSMYIIPGAQSTVVVPSLDSMTFTIMDAKLSLSALDKPGQLSLFKLKTEGEERHAVIKEKKGLKGGDSNPIEKIAYTTRNEGDKIMMILSQKPAPGEYAFLGMKSLWLDKTIEVFCFRVE